jgi:hypothetical protein
MHLKPFPTLATPVIAKDAEADNEPSTADDDKGHKDVVATSNETMAPP